jgi:glycosyltransferase involved in cell wall biosynthesis
MHVVFYDDADFFGGHEKQTVEILKVLSRRQGLRITFLAFEGNARLRDRIAAIGGNVSLRPIPYRTRKAEWLKLVFETPEVSRLARLLKELRPDRFVLCAGDIDRCLKGLYAAKMAGYKCITYIPVAQRASFLGSRLGKLRDRIQEFFYRRVDFWITISHGMAERISERGVPPDRIRVVYNGLDTSVLRRVPKAEARAALGLPTEGYLIGNIGRVNFFQKNQGLIAEAMAAHPQAFAGALVAFVGEGEDEAALRALLASRGLEGRARMLPFQEDVSLVYSSLDMLLIASRVEGMPLVMTEAMHFGLPIVSSDVDGMREILPAEWRYPSGDAGALAERVAAVRGSDQSQRCARNREILARDFGLEGMGRTFLSALEDAPACASR